MAYKRFFLNDHLHRVIRTERARNRLTAFDFLEDEFKVYPYSEFSSKKKRAVSVLEVAEIFGFNRKTVNRHIADRLFPEPQREHHIVTKKPGAYFFSEKDLYNYHEYLTGSPSGKNRLDGSPRVRKGIPSRDDLRVLMQYGRILYVKDGSNFIPVWRAEEW
jgi:hypothetical protein